VEPTGIEPRDDHRIDVSGDDEGELLVRWLSEILYLHEAEGFLPCAFRVAYVASGRAEGVVTGELYDPSRHRILAQIKAVTYHQIEVVREQDGWRARVILDV